MEAMGRTQNAELLERSRVTGPPRGLNSDSMCVAASAALPSLCEAVERFACPVCVAAGFSFLLQSRCQCCPPQWRHGRHCADQASPSAGRSLRASDVFLSSEAARLGLSRSRFLGTLGFTSSACPPLSVRRRWWALRDSASPSMKRMASRVALRSPGAAPEDMRRTSSIVRVWSSRRRTELASFSARTESAMRWAAGRDRFILSSW
eukprot:6213051-Pleurochrysis_carterae.AAC.7